MNLIIDKKPWSRGVTQLMYVGGDDDEIERGLTRNAGPNEHAIVLCKVGLGIAALGILLGNKRIRNVGAITAVGGFIAI